MDEVRAEPDRRVPWPGVIGRRVFRTMGWLASRYTRLDYQGPDALPPPPALLVLNHGFGGLFDLNVLAFAELSHRLGLDDDMPATYLAHQMAWTLGAGPLLEPAGLRPADPSEASAALARGEYVVVIPGGDVDAGKPWTHRNEVRFGGRRGFARLAIDAGVPIVPTVIVGAGESLFVLSDGQRAAHLLGIDRRLRNKTLPVTLSLPWGLSVGLVGLAPYFPLPTKLRAATGPAFRAEDGETPEALAERVHTWMQATADELTAGRIPLLGWQRRHP